MSKPSVDDVERQLPEPADLDRLLATQLIIAWAGESGEEPRLGWWKTDMSSEFGGQDLFKRLTPRSWEWTTLQAAREAAHRCDLELRSQAHDPDELVSLFGFDFEISERLEERLHQLKIAGRSPIQVLPDLGKLPGHPWDPASFSEWVREHGSAEFSRVPVGRRLKGPPPSALETSRCRLVAALLPLSDSYPLPHFRRAR